MDYNLSYPGCWVSMAYRLGGVEMINMEYRKVFVTCIREENMVYVQNDRNYVDSYWTETETEEEFEKECAEYLESDRFKEKLKQQRGF